MLISFFLMIELRYVVAALQERRGKFCKHKVQLLKNRSELLVENQQIDELSIMLCELRDQALFHELELLCQAEAIHDAAVVSLNEAKKRFEIVLRGE